MAPTTEAIERKLRDCLRWATRRCERDGCPPPAYSVRFLVKLWDKQDGLCALTGTPLTLKGPAGATLDRIDPAKGYTRANTAIVTSSANRAKSDLTLAEFRKLCRAVLRWTA